jgi:hypothetical protein
LSGFKEQLGRPQLILSHQRQPALDQTRGIPASPLEDPGIHRPQMRRHHQAAGQHQQASAGAEQESIRTASHTFIRA